MGGCICEEYLFHCSRCGEDRPAWKRFCPNAPPQQEGKERPWCRLLVPRQIHLSVCPECEENGLKDTEEELKDYLLIEELKGRHGSRAS